jgi:hypothetical protein
MSVSDAADTGGDLLAISVVSYITVYHIKEVLARIP